MRVIREIRGYAEIEGQVLAMAKYKFTKTIKPNEGICIDANGTITR